MLEALYIARSLPALPLTYESPGNEWLSRPPLIPYHLPFKENLAD